FDCMWWFNFVLKWQDVSLRMTSFRGADSPAVVSSLRHFFREPDFQRWSMANTPGRPVSNWRAYKEEAKSYILDHTGDETYFRTKEKEDSLRNVFANPEGGSVFRVFMREEFIPVVAEVQPAPLFSAKRALDSLRVFRAQG
ncbi:MAG: hypothetical protein ABL994_23165, partial [Verrucomicrobiales bacterium]